MESILTSIKEMLGIKEEYTHFDTSVITHINTVLQTLKELGVGPEKGFSIKDKSASWADFLGDRTDLEAVKSYVYLKVRLLFDPPASSVIVKSIEELALEYEWRINVDAEHVPAESD